MGTGHSEVRVCILSFPFDCFQLPSFFPKGVHETKTDNQNQAQSAKQKKGPCLWRRSANRVHPLWVSEPSSKQHYPICSRSNIYRVSNVFTTTASGARLPIIKYWSMQSGSRSRRCMLSPRYGHMLICGRLVAQPQNRAPKDTCPSPYSLILD